MANEKKKVHRYFEVYEAMKKAVPDDNNMLEVMRACEFIIADCIARRMSAKKWKNKPTRPSLTTSGNSLRLSSR